jgi:hypothetical protein
VEGGTVASALMPPGAPPTESHPVPTQRRAPAQPPPSGRPAHPATPRCATPIAGRPAHRALARIGRLTGFIGTLLALIAVLVFIVVATALPSTEHSVSGLVDGINHEINKVKPPNH